MKCKDSRVDTENSAAIRKVISDEEDFEDRALFSPRSCRNLLRAWAKTAVYTKIFPSDYLRQYLRSSVLYIIASDIWSAFICSLPSRSAMVRATLKTLS